MKGSGFKERALGLNASETGYKEWHGQEVKQTKSPRIKFIPFSHTVPPGPRAPEGEGGLSPKQ